MFIKQLLLVFILTSSIKARVSIVITDYPLVQFLGRIYKKHLLTDQYNNPKELHYDAKSQNLYFMYMDDRIQNSGRAFVNVVTKESQKIKGIVNNKAVAVNTVTGAAYFGSENGLYKYDPEQNEAKNVALYNINITKLVIKNNVTYLLDANNHKLYKVFEDGLVAIKIADWKGVIDFQVDNDDNIYFVTVCGVFCALKGHETIRNDELKNVNHFVIDGDRTLAFTDDNVYEVNCKDGSAEKIANLDFFPSSLLMDDDGDIFYSEDDNIFHLKPLIKYVVYNIRQRRF